MCLKELFLFFKRHKRNDERTQVSEKSPIKYGVFFRNDASRVLVWEWDESEEMFKKIEDEVLKAQVREMKFDRGMGAYPVGDQEKKWNNITSFIDERVLKRCGVKFGDTLVPGDPDVTAKQNRNSKTVTPYFTAKFRTVAFTNVDFPKPKGLRGVELSRFYMDGTERLRILLRTDTMFGPTNRNAGQQFLGELQLAFVLLLCLSSMQALEHWKRLLKVVCDCESGLADESLTPFFMNFLDVLETQLMIVPSDFFIDPLSSNNFLLKCFSDMSRNLCDVETTSSSNMIRKRFEATKEIFRLHFKQDLNEVMEAFRMEEISNENSNVSSRHGTPFFTMMNSTNKDTSSSTKVDETSNSTTSSVGRMAWMLPPHSSPSS